MAGKSGAIRAGGAFVELFADSTKLKAGLASAGAMVKNFAVTGVRFLADLARKIVKIGAVIVTALAGAIAGAISVGIRGALDYAGHISDVSARTGIAAANQWVRQHINGLIPRLGVTYTRRLNDDESVGVDLSGN